ncbi:signal peptidase II [Lacticaseibacillus hulanensis]|uniref:signal peptidase II n=1 Tax=Lacticaseibacillus hulanensis TaxID=2493111 RepID=UPI0013E2CE31|nr:signal peptidase II [Lacticaseibacillus hulanensis]
MIIYLILSAVLIVADQLLKSWVATNIALNTSHTLIPGVLSFTNLRNDGAAWSMFSGQQWFFYIVTIVALIVVAFLWRDSKNKPMYRLGLAFILAGAIGNFIDRLHQQYVVDMFQTDFINFPIFNIADMCLTVGVILVAVYIIFFDNDGGKQ